MSASRDIWESITGLLDGDAHDYAVGMGEVGRNEYVCRAQRGEATIEELAAEITAEAAEPKMDIESYVKPGTYYRVEDYVGRKHSGHMEWVGVQIVAYHRGTSRRRCVFGRSPCYKIRCGSHHTRTGEAKWVQEVKAAARVELTELADALNAASQTGD